MMMTYALRTGGKALAKDSDKIENFGMEGKTYNRSLAAQVTVSSIMGDYSG